MSMQETALTTPTKQGQRFSRPSLVSTVPDSTSSSSSSSSTPEKSQLPDDVILLSYSELVERIPGAVQRFLECNASADESVHVYIGSTSSVAKVLECFPSHPTGDHISDHLSYNFVHADDLLHVYLREVSSGNAHCVGVRMLGELFGIWRRQSRALTNVVTAASDGTTPFGSVSMAPDLMIIQSNISSSQPLHPRGK
jgi:hypothetical protein